MKNLGINYLITKLQSLVLITFVLCNSDAFAGYSVEEKKYIDQSYQTNVNKVNPFFEEQIENLHGLNQSIESGKNGGLESLSNSSMLGEIPGYDNSSSEVDNLSSISASELESRGREEMAKEPMMNKIFIDHNDPLIQQDKRDINEIILKETRGLLNNILEGLKKQGIDCEAVAGNEIIEPEYQVETEAIETQNRVYDKVLCEHLKNQYDCNDMLSVRCNKKAMQWEEWKDRTIDYYDVQYHWLYPIHWKKRRYGMHMKNDANIMDQVRRGIANKLRVDVEHIHPHIGIDPRGKGEIRESGRHEVKWDYYVFQYKYREGKLVCIEWSDTWSETCRLK